MRVLIVGPVYSDSFAENVAVAVRRLGHEAICEPATSIKTYQSLRRRITNRLKTIAGIPLRSDDWVISATRQLKPHMVLALTTTVTEETLSKLKQLGVVARCAWWGDPPANMQQLGLLSSEWDAIFLKDPAAVIKFRRVGLSANLLHEAMNPDWHRPLAKSRNSRVAVVGNFYGYRDYLTQRLVKAGVPLDLYGPPPPRWSSEVVRSLHTGRYVVKEEKSRIFGEAIAALNSSTLAEGNSLNCRAFEIAGAAGLQILEDKPIVGECFQPGAEVLTYDSIEELVEKLDWVRREPQKAEAIRTAAARRALSQHTYAHRLAAIFDHVGLS